MKIIASACVAAGLLTACGGGGGTGPVIAPTPTNVSGTDVPIAATQGPDAAFSFVAQVAATKNDSAEPLTVGDADLANSETEEPRPL